MLSFRLHTLLGEIRKNYKLKIADAIIAATALTSEWTLLANNENDFGKISSLKISEPMKNVYFFTVIDLYCHFFQVVQIQKNTNILR